MLAGSQIFENSLAEMDMDEWGKDPAVQALRKVFKGMETSLVQIIEGLAISPYDHRIRGWLEIALPKFEKAWHLAHQTDMNLREEAAPVVYAHCLAKVIASAGVEIPDDLLPAAGQIRKLVNEVFT